MGYSVFAIITPVHFFSNIYILLFFSIGISVIQYKPVTGKDICFHALNIFIKTVQFFYAFVYHA